jgi:hypothetical protein
VQVLSCLPVHSVIYDMSNKKLDISERKLGRHKALGLFWVSNKKIEMDPRLKAKKYLHVLVHELLHKSQEELTEEGVERVSKIIAKGVWQQGYRRICK